MTPEERNAIARRILGSSKRLFNALVMADPVTVQHCLTHGADPNARNRRGTPILVRAVRGQSVNAEIVRILLDAGADPTATDADGCTALDHVRRRLAVWESRLRRTPRRLPSLTEHGDIRLHDFESEALDEMHITDPDIADEFEEHYLQGRREIAERVHDPRGTLEKIAEMLEARPR